MPSPPELTGLTLKERYRLTALLGAGGMGQVYEGMDETLDRKVAVKVLLRKLADDERFHQRFLREAKAASKIQHPNVVQIIDFGQTPGGSVFYAMEFLKGRDLAALLRAERVLPWPRVRHILLQIVRALGATHDRNIIHRDIKPANFFVLEARGLDDFIKLLDFGIAKFAVDPDNEEKSLAMSLTGAGEVMGTAKYMAPEQAYGDSNDPRVDIYAVGIVAYELLTGSVPFTGASVFEILKQHVDTMPRPLREHDPSLAPEVEAFVLRALAKTPEGRFASMDEMEAALQSIPADASGATHVPPAVGVGNAAGAAPNTNVLDQRASNEALRASGARIAEDRSTAPRHVEGNTAQAPVLEAVEQVASSPLATSDMVTENKRRPSRPPTAVGASTFVAPMKPRPPSPVTHGEIGRAMGAPSAQVTDRPSGEVSSHAPNGPTMGDGMGPAAGATSRIAMRGDVGSATGPNSSSVAGVETDPHAVAMAAAPDSGVRTGAKVLGGLALLVGVAFGGYSMMGSDADPDPAVESKPAVAKADVKSSSETPAVVDTPAVVVEPPAESSGASSSGGGGSSGASPESSPEPEPEPEPEPKPPAAPKKQPPAKKPSKPLTDRQVASRLGRTLKKKCRSLADGQSVTVNLIVSSAGKVLTPTVQGVDGELRKCLTRNAGSSSFPAGTTRKVSVSVKF